MDNLTKQEKQLIDELLKALGFTSSENKEDENEHQDK